MIGCRSVDANDSWLSFRPLLVDDRGLNGTLFDVVVVVTVLSLEGGEGISSSGKRFRSYANYEARGLVKFCLYAHLVRKCLEIAISS